MTKTIINKLMDIKNSIQNLEHSTCMLEQHLNSSSFKHHINELEKDLRELIILQKTTEGDASSALKHDITRIRRIIKVYSIVHDHLTCTDFATTTKLIENQLNRGIFFNLKK